LPPNLAKFIYSLAATVAIALAATAFAVTPGCGKKEPGSSSKDKAKDATPVEGPRDPKLATAPPEGPTGTIHGIVHFDGKAPEMPLIQNGADVECAKQQIRAETVLVNQNLTLRDVLVRIAPGAAPVWAPDQPVVVDQNGCMFRPRVQGATIGQALEIRNSDHTSHNIHIKMRKLRGSQATETIFNQGQPAGTPPLKTRVLNDADIYELHCDQHSWMIGYIVLADHPYQAVTGVDGSFTIRKAPVGKYKVQAWHALYGIKEQEVTVAEGKTAELEFTFDAVADNPSKKGKNG
jgi:hypothetical protein